MNDVKLFPVYLLPASLRSSPPADLATTFAFLLHAHLPFTPLPQFLLVCPQKRGYSFNQQGVQTTWNYGRVIFYLEKWSSPVLAPSIGRTLSLYVTEASIGTIDRFSKNMGQGKIARNACFPVFEIST